MSASHFGIKGAEQYTYGLYTRRDAVTLRDRFMADVERLSEGSPSAQLAITMVGGGATGVELAGTMAELRDGVLRDTFPDVDPARIHVRVVEMQPDLLGPFNKKLRDYTRDQLVKRGVDVQLNTAIAEVTPDRVILKDGRDLRSDITVWTAGVAAPPAAKAWGLPQGHAGRIETGPDLRIKGQDRIFAAGDIGLVTDDPTPQVSQPAIQMGLHAARQIMRLEAGQPTETFHYHDKGQAATIGRKSAVIELAKGPRLHRHPGLAGLARAAPVLPARRPEPGDRADQPGLALHDLGPRRLGHRRGRADRQRRARGFPPGRVPADRPWPWNVTTPRPPAGQGRPTGTGPASPSPTTTAVVASGHRREARRSPGAASAAFAAAVSHRRPRAGRLRQRRAGAPSAAAPSSSAAAMPTPTWTSAPRSAASPRPTSG